MKKETKTVKETVKTAEQAPVKAAATEAEVKAKKEIVEEKVAKSAAAAKAEVKKVEKKAVETVKAAVKKAPVKKTAVKETVYLQYLGKEIDKDQIMKQVKEIWTKQLKNKAGDMKSVTLYLKPEENAAYYVINDDVTGKIDL